MYEFLLLSDLEGLKSALEIFKEQSHVIRIVAPATFFKKAVQKIFRKCLEKRLWQGSHLPYLPAFKLANKIMAAFFMATFYALQEAVKNKIKRLLQ